VKCRENVGRLRTAHLVTLSARAPRWCPLAAEEHLVEPRRRRAIRVSRTPVPSC